MRTVILLFASNIFMTTTAALLSYQLCISARRRLFHVQEIMLTKTVG